MVSINDAVIAKPVFEKIADSTISDDSTKWHEEILQKFFEEVDYLPQNVGSDIVLSSVDENKGYGKGSVVVWFKDKKINFPIIIRDFKISPFDTFVVQENGESVYMPANFENIKKLISSSGLGTLENIWDKGTGQLPGVKTPGGVYPKQLVDVNAEPLDLTYPPFSKMSGWREHARKEDLEKLSDLMERNPAVMANYVDNTGDLMTNVINLADSKKKTIADTNKTMDIDLNGLINAKRAVTVIDSELFDVNQLQPVSPPSVCELRLYEYPSMEDFIESGSGPTERLLATRNGRPVVGVVVDMKEESDFNNNCPAIASCSPSNPSDPVAQAKAIRQERNQIFISVDGSCFCTFRDYDKTGIGFYGSKVIPIGGGAVEKVLKMISQNTSDDFVSSNNYNRKDGSDKLFNPINTMDQGQSDYPSSYPCSDSYRSQLAIVYGAEDAFECVTFRGKFRKISVNGVSIYTSGEAAIIPANIASVQRVSSVESPVYKMAVLGAKVIYLIPESAIVFNTEYMKEYRKEDFMRPNLPMQKVYEDSAISKVAVEVNPDGGYSISGEPYEGIKKIAGDVVLTTPSAVSALRIMGMSKEAAETVLKHAINRYISKTAEDKKVFVYGLRSDYVNTDFNPRAGIEKSAKHKNILIKIAALLKKNLIKEASAINDPEAVDVVLSLNFINEDSLKGFVDNIGEMRRILSELSKMLVASRLGLSDLDESALTKSIQGLDEVIRGLENIKLAIK